MLVISWFINCLMSRKVFLTLNCSSFNFFCDFWVLYDWSCTLWIQKEQYIIFKDNLCFFKRLVVLEFIFCWKTRISFASNWHSTNEHLIFQMSSFRLKLPRHIFDKKRVPSLYALSLCYSTYSIIPIDSSLKVWGLTELSFLLRWWWYSWLHTVQFSAAAAMASFEARGCGTGTLIDIYLLTYYY